MLLARLCVSTTNTDINTTSSVCRIDALNHHMYLLPLKRLLTVWRDGLWHVMQTFDMEEGLG